jgi:hypothetical protein
VGDVADGAVLDIGAGTDLDRLTSPRNTAPGQIETSSASLTWPITQAAGSIQTRWPIWG